MTVGVLALQGDVREHRAVLESLGVATRPVRARADLHALEGLVLPGGESTTLSLLLSSSGLFEPLAERLTAGLPVFGTCAGLVLLATEVRGGRPDQRSFGLLDCAVRRNGYGRQRESFETTLDVPVLAEELEEPRAAVPAVFIRAPVVEETGPGVEVLAWFAGPDGLGPRPVFVRQGSVLASAFHPELTGDARLHQLFLGMLGPRETPGHEASMRAGPGVPAGATWPG